MSVARPGLRARTIRVLARRHGLTIVDVSDALHESADRPHGTSLLPRDLTPEQLRAAPVLVSLDALLIGELSDDEDEAFGRAIES